MIIKRHIVLPTGLHCLIDRQKEPCRSVFTEKEYNTISHSESMVEAELNRKLL